MYRILISPIATKRLKTIAKIYRKGIAESIESLKEDPMSGKPLVRELAGRYSYRVGFYRIIYKINKKDKIVYIIDAGHRSIIYQ